MAQINENKVRANRVQRFDMIRTTVPITVQEILRFFFLNEADKKLFA